MKKLTNTAKKYIANNGMVATEVIGYRAPHSAAIAELPVIPSVSYETLPCGLMTQRVSNIISAHPYCDIKDPHFFQKQGTPHIIGSSSDYKDGPLSIPLFKLNMLTDIWDSEGKMKIKGYQPGPRFCAPGVIMQDDILHVFAQSDCFQLGSTIEHFVVDGNPMLMRYQGTAITSNPNTSQAAVYDSDPFAFTDPNGNNKFGLLYTGYRDFANYKPQEGAIFAAAASSLNGPWKKLERPLLTEEDIPGHVGVKNNGEWCIEGGGITCINDFGQSPWFLLHGVMFGKGEPMNVQRAFLAASKRLEGPYVFITDLPPIGKNFGETGHGSMALEEETVVFYHQERFERGNWHYSKTVFNQNALFQYITLKLYQSSN